MEKYIPKGAKWIKDKVTELDPDYPNVFGAEDTAQQELEHMQLSENKRRLQ